MIAVRVFMKVTDEPLKRTPVVIRMDADDTERIKEMDYADSKLEFDIVPAVDLL